MRIGIVSPIDLNYFSNEFSDIAFKRMLKENSNNQVATAVHTLVKTFIENGHFVRIYTLSKKDFVIKEKHIEIYGIGDSLSYLTKFTIGDFIKARRIKNVVKDKFSDLDVLHAHWTYTYAYAVKDFAKEIPMFCTVRDWASYIWKIETLKNKITWSFKLLMNELVFRNNKVNFISNSPYTAARIKKKYKIDTPIIPNPIKDDFLRFENIKQPDNLELICISSSNDHRKNVRTLLVAFKMLLQEFPDAHLSLIGGPFVNNNKDLKPWMDDDLLNRVTLVGSIKHEELKVYFDRSIIFVTPSLEETFGNTLLESMARKVPIVAGINSGAIPYVVQQGKAGFLCDVSKAEEIYKTIKRVYLNPNEVEKITKAAFELLESNYLGSIIMEKHIELYKEKATKHD